MGRLTKRINAEISKGLTYEAIIYKDIEHHETDFNYKALDKLAHYEDLESQGRLIVVRCKVCEHYDTQDCGEGAGWCRAVNAGRFDDWYCDNAKLKEIRNDSE